MAKQTKPDILLDPEELDNIVNFVERMLNGMAFIETLDEFVPNDLMDVKLSPEEYLALRETIKKLK